MARISGIDTKLDKLQDYLLTMVPGDELSAQKAAEISGLDPRRCNKVLDALMHVGLMIRLQHAAYVRCRLGSAERH